MDTVSVQLYRISSERKGNLGSTQAVVKTLKLVANSQEQLAQMVHLASTDGWSKVKP